MLEVESFHESLVEGVGGGWLVGGVAAIGGKDLLVGGWTLIEAAPPVPIVVPGAWDFKPLQGLYNILILHFY